MHDLGLHPRSKHRKCAKISGDTSGNYHPHGDGVIYPTLVRLGQEWSMRHLLIDPQGNFGSIDGDPPAAMRYTEARLAAAAELMLTDIDKETVDFEDNFDGTRKSPWFCRASSPTCSSTARRASRSAWPRACCRTTSARSAKPSVAIINNPELPTEELMRIVPGPDFPTGGVVCGSAGIREAYETGRGALVSAASCTPRRLKSGRTNIVVDEIPYGVLLPTIKDRILDACRTERSRASTTCAMSPAASRWSAWLSP